LHTARINALAWSPDGRRIASGSADKTVRVWDPTRGEELLRFDVPDTEVTQCQWSPEGRRLAASGADGAIRIWDASTGYHFLNSQEYVREQMRAQEKEARELWDAGRQADALSLLERTLKTLSTTLDPDHEETLFCLDELAHAYEGVGRFPEAVALHEQLLAKQKTVPGPDAIVMLGYMICLTRVYQEAGRLDRADSLSVDLLAQLRKSSPSRLGGIVNGLPVLGLNYLKQNKYAEAEPLWRERLRILEVISPNDWRTFNTKSMIGVSLLGQARYAEAEPQLLAGYEGMKQREETIPAEAKIRLTEAVERLVQLYDALSEPRKAAVWRARLGRADLPDDVFARP
jgi:tetratricopeptide (TPR) repeat protein